MDLVYKLFKVKSNLELELWTLDLLWTGTYTVLCQGNFFCHRCPGFVIKVMSVTYISWFSKSQTWSCVLCNHKKKKASEIQTLGCFQKLAGIWDSGGQVSPVEFLIFLFITWFNVFASFSFLSEPGSTSGCAVTSSSLSDHWAGTFHYLLTVSVSRKGHDTLFDNRCTLLPHVFGWLDIKQVVYNFY